MIYNKYNNNNDEVIIEVFGYKRLKQYKEYLKKYAIEVKLLQYDDDNTTIISEEII